MMKTLNLKNEEIYNYAVNIAENFKEDIALPIKINFYLQKNLKLMMEKGQEIEQSRMTICQKYGTLNEENGSYSFEGDAAKDASKEIVDLFELEQEIKIYMIKLSAFTDDIALTSKQLAAISFMIDDEEEE